MISWAASAVAGGAHGSASMSAAPSSWASSAIRGAGVPSSRGEVLWRSRHGGEIRARLSYVISGQESAAGKLLLTYRYRREGADLSFEHEVELDCSPGERSCASCPACGRHVRSLYAPTGADLFACRSCWGSYERAAASASSRLRNWRIETTFSSRKATCGEATGDGSLEVRPGKS